jgi:hypothetical protein
MKTLKVLVAFGICLLMAAGLFAQNANVSLRTGTIGAWDPIMSYAFGGGGPLVPLPDSSWVGIYLTGADLMVNLPSDVWGYCGDPTGDDQLATNQIGTGGLRNHLVMGRGEPRPTVPFGNLFTGNGAIIMTPAGSGTEPTINIGDRMYLRAFNAVTPMTATHYNDMDVVGGVSQNWYMRSASGAANVIVSFTAPTALNCVEPTCNPQEAAGPEGPINIGPGTTHYFFGESETHHCTLWITAGAAPVNVTATLLNMQPNCKPFPNTTYMTRVYDLEGGGGGGGYFTINMGYSQTDYDATSWAGQVETGMHVAYYLGDYGNCIGAWRKVEGPHFPAPAVITDNPQGGYATFQSNHLSMWSFGWGNIGDTTQLPVELTSFEAAAGDHSVRLSWNTASETNNGGFYIQRSTTENDYDFTTVSDLIATQGNGATSHDYTWTDTRLNNGVVYYYRLADEDINLNVTIHPSVVHATPSFFGEAVVVTEYKLYQNYPNPFNPTSNIAYDVKDAGFVTLKVYNVMGQEVKTLVNEHRPMGRFAISFDATGLSSGIYFYTVKVNNFSDTKKMLLVQ